MIFSPENSLIACKLYNWLACLMKPQKSDWSCWYGLPISRLSRVTFYKGILWQFFWTTSISQLLLLPRKGALTNLSLKLMPLLPSFTVISTDSSHCEERFFLWETAVFTHLKRRLFFKILTCILTKTHFNPKFVLNITYCPLFQFLLEGFQFSSLAVWHVNS